MSTTGEKHIHDWRCQDTISRPMCCTCYAVLLPDGNIQCPDGLVELVNKGYEDIIAGRVIFYRKFKEQSNETD